MSEFVFMSWERLGIREPLKIAWHQTETFPVIESGGLKTKMEITFLYVSQCF